jgi:hypothetical protein
MSNKAVMYDDNLYTPNNGDTVSYDSVTGKFIPVPLGSGGGGFTPITYSALSALAGSSNLVPGAFYEITDFRTSHYIQFSGPVTGSGGIGGEEVNLGPIEPLVVQAVSYSELSVNASSSTYPNDKILYLLSVPDGDYDYAAASGRGCIIYRENTPRKVARDYDWRSVVFRRWETSPSSGDYYSCTPVVGSAYQDVSPFTYPDTYFNTYIKSPLDNPVEFIINPSGFNYWLDNTVLDATTVTDFQCNFAYVNHLTGYVSQDLEATINNINVMVNNIIAVQVMTINEINALVNNNIIQSYIDTFGDGDPFTGNTVDVFSGNDISGYTYSNIGLNIANNQLVNVIGNKFLSISQNIIASEISQNTGAAITGNIADSISYNNVAFIESNDCKDIQGNFGLVYNNNIMVGDIITNVVKSVTDNTCATISENVGSGISNNVSPVAFISNNTSNIIVDNSNNGNISQNVSDYIYNNSNDGDIIYNNCRTITGNSNSGYISGNVGQIISDNSNTAFIEENTVNTIYNNSAGVNRIRKNVGYEISDNTFTGDISNNSVHSIVLNDGTGELLGNHGQFISGNAFIDDFRYNTCHTFDSNAFGNSAGANVIENHNFIDSVKSKIITPTVDMNSSTIFTKSMYDVNLAQHYEVSLAAGTISYTAIT